MKLSWSVKPIKLLLKEKKPTTYKQWYLSWLVNFFCKKSGFVICETIIWPGQTFFKVLNATSLWHSSHYSWKVLQIRRGETKMIYPITIQCTDCHLKIILVTYGVLNSFDVNWYTTRHRTHSVKATRFTVLPEPILKKVSGWWQIPFQRKT